MSNDNKNENNNKNRNDGRRLSVQNLHWCKSTIPWEDIFAQESWCDC